MMLQLEIPFIPFIIEKMRSHGAILLFIVALLRGISGKCSVFSAHAPIKYLATLFADGG
jgi:hypothetical protein